MAHSWLQLMSPTEALTQHRHSVGQQNALHKGCQSDTRCTEVLVCTETLGKLAHLLLTIFTLPQTQTEIGRFQVSLHTQTKILRNQLLFIVMGML